jgi:PKD repeat protein
VLQADPGDYAKIASSEGTLYVVSGCGGRTGTGTLDHPLMARSLGDVAGFSVIDVSWNELRGSFVERDGRTSDLFVLRKASDVEPPRLATLEARAADEVVLVFAEPVRPGTGAGGAEDPGRYLILPAVAVLGARLESDQRTLVLHTSSLAPNRVHELSVLGVADALGNAGDARARFVLAQSASQNALVPRGSEWRYLPGLAAPPPDWSALSFDDSGWPLGPAGFGYEDGDDATLLGDMRGQYESVYLRRAFEVSDPELAVGLQLRVSYDDGFVAFLNGVEIARSNVPAGQTSTTLASASHEAGTFEAFDVSVFALRTGTNVLAVEGHNFTLDSNDFSLHPELVLALDAPGGPPRAVLSSTIHTANPPVRVRFSSARSSDDEGPLEDVQWDFGDGSPVTSGPHVTHVYDRVGHFTASLTVTDGDGLQSLAELPLRIHGVGQGPRAELSASPLVLDPGTSVSFSSAGSRDPDGGPLFVQWDFGDPASGAANRSQEAESAHVYSSPGTYLATLAVVDDEGSTVTSVAAITVQPPPGPLRTFQADADAMVRSTSPDNNYGSEPMLRVRGGSPEFRAYVRFRLTGVDGVASAKLRLYASDGSNDGGELLAADAGWSEAEISWNGAPPTHAPLGSLGAVASGSWLEHDVTSVVGGDGAYAFLLRSSSTDSAFYSSREGTHPPELVITAGPPPDRTPPVVLGREPGPGASSVPRETRVRASFDEPVQGVSDATFLLLRRTEAVAAQVSYDAATRTAVLQPLEELAHGTPYQVVLSGGIADLSGNALVPARWFFTTAAPPLTFPPAADAMVKSTSPDSNYGAEPMLRVRAGDPEWRTYLRFDVDGMNGRVSSARLRLFVSDPSKDGGALHAVADGWSEAGLTWGNAPAPAQGPLALAGEVTAGSWVEYDVSSHIRGNGSYAFALLSSSTNSAFFSSREGSHPPELLVEFSDEGGPLRRESPAPISAPPAR